MKNQSGNYKKIFTLFVISFFLIACKKETDSSLKAASSSNNNASDTALISDPSLSPLDISETGIPNTFLWKIEKSGLPVSYLLGTVHLGKTGAVLPEHVLESFTQTEVLMTEASLDDPLAMQTLMSVMFDLTAPLSTKVGKKRFELLSKALAAEGMMPQNVEQLQPWAAVMMLMYNRPEGYSPLSGVDMLLTNKANETKKSKLALESALDQIKLFTELPEDKLLSLMDGSLIHAEEAKKQSQKMLDLYERNQANALFKLTEDEDFNLQNLPSAERDFWRKWLYQDLLINRTAKWLPIIEEQLPKQTTFIAVGTAHIYGEKGLITLLKDKGYTVSAVMPK